MQEFANLQPIPHQSSLAPIARLASPKYVNVTIKRKDMEIAISRYIVALGGSQVR